MSKTGRLAYILNVESDGAKSFCHGTLGLFSSTGPTCIAELFSKLFADFTKPPALLGGANGVMVKAADTRG